MAARKVTAASAATPGAGGRRLACQHGVAHHHRAADHPPVHPAARMILPGIDEPCLGDQTLAWRPDLADYRRRQRTLGGSETSSQKRRDGHER